MIILGVSALYHDAAAAVIKDGVILAAAQEERFTRVKMDPALPVNAIRYCLQEAGNLRGCDLDAVAYYDDPALTLHRFLFNVSADGSDTRDLISTGAESVFSRKLWIERLLREELGSLGREDRLLVVRHHLSHAASAFYPSPFERAAILTVDGVGEWDTLTIGEGNGNRIRLLKKLEYPHSLGLLYSAFTYFCGFRVNFGDYKLMGLAPYGEPVYADLIRRELIDIREDGSFRLNLRYFDFQYGRAMTNDAFSALFGGERRLPESPITKREMDLAASVQAVTEDVLLRLAQTARRLTGLDHLVMAGGVALNCTANGKLRKKELFSDIWIQPAAGDAGGALGAALAVWYQYFGKDRIPVLPDGQQGSFLGPSWSDEEILQFLREKGCRYHFYGDQLFDRAARELEAGKVVGLFEGRMEYGPRALGHRSILADPRSEEMQTRLNLSIKYRESFRPFAPAVTVEDCGAYFSPSVPSPYMLFCADVNEREDTGFDFRKQLSENPDMLPVLKRRRSPLPAVTHMDYSARLQTVDPGVNPFFYEILCAFKRRTGCSVLINTSFNVRGEPIVCSPEDAWNCFMHTEMDVLILQNYLLYKEEQEPVEGKRHEFELD